jgi:DNA primase
MQFGFQSDIKERVKQSVDIVEWIGRDLQLTRRAGKFRGLCPFHADTNPSFEVNPARQSYVCWVCNLRGDIFDYVMRREAVEFREALTILAEYAGIPLAESQTRLTKGSADDKQTLYRAMAWAVGVYQECLLQGESAAPVRDYLEQRGISQAMIEVFQLGFAPLSFSFLADKANKTEFSPKILEACGLVSATERGSFYERFRGRLVFPIYDTQQRPIAFGGRLVPGIYGSEEEPRGKYVNSNETRLFSKSHQLYGLNLFVKDLDAARKRKLTVVEGYTDVIAAYQVGLRNVVACLGTAINDNHIRLMKRFADQVTLVLDGDQAGRTRANQVLDLFVAHDLDLRIQTLPNNQDPFDFCREQGANEFQQLVDEAPDAIGHKIRTETAGLDLTTDTHAANQALENILKTLATVPLQRFASSPALGLRHDQIVTRLSRHFGIDRDRIRKRLIELRTKSRPIALDLESAEPTQEFNPAKWDRKESELVQILTHVPSLLDVAMENIPPSLFEEGTLKELYEQMEQAYHVGDSVGYQQLMLRLEQPTLKAALDYLHDEAEAKLSHLRSDDARREQLTEQFDAVMRTYQNLTQRSWHQTTIAKLQDGQLDDQDEILALAELLRQTQQQQRLNLPTDG